VVGKKNYRIRTGARTASKGLEKDLKRRAVRLSQDPSLALPRCTVDVPYFKKLERRLKEIQSFKDDRKALEGASKKGDRLARAYAGTLLLLHEEKIPFLAVLKSPYGDVGYALRGETSKEKLAGIQNYEDPQIKMLAYLEEVKKDKLFLFVTKDEVICTGSDPKPPKEVVDALPGRLGAGMKRTGKVIHSPDLDPRVVSSREAWKEPYMVVTWESAGIELARSLSHARQNEDNMFATCASYMATEKLSDHFKVGAVVEPLCRKGKACICHPPPKVEVKEPFWKRLGKVKALTDSEVYLQGQMMDHRFIEKERDRYEGLLREAGKTLFVVGNVCYNDSRTDLMKALSPGEREKRALEAFFRLVKGPVLAPEPSANRILAPFWQDIGEPLLKDISGDASVAKEVFTSMPVPRYQPMNVIEEAEFRVEEVKIMKALPRPISPPRMVEFAYQCAVAFMARGVTGASKVLERFPDDDIKLKAAKYAFVKGLDLSRSSGWSYTSHEMGYAQGMDEIVDRIITRDPHSFQEGLIELWKATGSTMELKFEKGNSGQSPGRP
jgi:hypothetical protein